MSTQKTEQQQSKPQKNGSAPKPVKPGTIVVSDRVRDWLSDKAVKKVIGDLLAGWMNVDEFLAQMMIALEKKGEWRYDTKKKKKVYNPGPSDCTPRSKFAALHKCAVLKLLPTLDQVAFVPYKNGDDELECTVTPQWQGYKALMERHPDVLEVEADIVCDGEHYRYDAQSRHFDHEYDPFEDRDVAKDLSNIKGGYLRIVYRDGRPPKFHFVTQHTILKAKSCAKTNVIWEPFALEMTLKTIYRNGYARRVIPIDPLVIRKMNTLLAGEDRVHQNDPSRAIRKEPAARPVSDLTAQLEGKPRIESKPEPVDFAAEAESGAEQGEPVMMEIEPDTIIGDTIIGDTVEE